MKQSLPVERTLCCFGVMTCARSATSGRSYCDALEIDTGIAVSFRSPSSILLDSLRSLCFSVTLKNGVSGYRRVVNLMVGSHPPYEALPVVNARPAEAR